MSYDTVATLSQTGSLLLFFVLFIAVVAYVMWPGNAERFRRAGRDALDLGKDPSDPTTERGDIR